MIDSLLAFAEANQVAVLVGLAAIVIIIVAVMAMVVARGVRKPAADVALPEDAKGALDLVALTVSGAESDEQKRALILSAKSLRRAMREGLVAYRERYARNPYLMPWVLRIGDPQDGGLIGALDEIRPPVGAESLQGVRWHYFEQGIIIDVPDSAALKSVFDFCIQRRPALPVDSILVTVPASALADVKQATERGTAIYNQLWLAQKELGFSVPIYVVITGAESLPGLQAFDDMLPRSLREGMIGWSFPYPLETAFSADYVAEALQSVQQSILAAVLEAFGSVMKPDAAFLLMRIQEDLAAIEEPLRACLATAFRRTAYQESHFFRGLYFIARHDPDSPADFARDLVERKVFPENGLSKMQRDWARARWLRRYAWPIGVAAAAVLAAITVLISVSSVDRYRALAEPILRATAADIEAVSSRRNHPEGADADIDAAVRYLRNVTTLDQNDPLVFAPFAWFGKDPYGVRAAMRAGWRRVALPGIKRMIDQRLESLGTHPGGDLTPDDAFARYLGRVAEAEASAKVYNQVLRGTGNPPVRDLLQYALRVSVPKGTLNKLEAWGAIGSDAEPVDDPDLRVDLAQYHKADLAVFHDLADAYFRRLADGGQVGARLTIVSSEMEDLAAGEHVNAQAVSGFAEVEAGLDDASHLLADGKPTWLGADSPVIPADIQQLIDAAAASDLLGQDAHDDAVATANRRYNEVKTRLGAVDSVIGPLVTRNANGAAALSPAAESLRQLLSTWLARSFMRQEAGTVQAKAGGFGWDAAALETIPPLFEDYLLFEVKELARAPQPLKAAMKATAQYRLGKLVQEDLDRASQADDAQAVEGSATIAMLRNWSRSLVIADPVLEHTVQTFNQIGMPQPAEQLRLRVAKLAEAILKRLDGLLDEDQLYHVNAAYLSSWRSGALSPPDLFGQASPGALLQYLDGSRAEMATLSREIAGPILEIMSHPALQPGGVSAPRWVTIASALDQYDASRPNSTLMTLEKFIKDDVPKIDDKNCLSITPAVAISEDFFAEKLEDVKTAIHQRCIAMADEKLRGAYLQVANYFNDHLAGRLPFAPTLVDGPYVATAELQQFYDIFDAATADVMTPIQTLGRTRPEWRDPARFLQSMAVARPLLQHIANGGSVIITPKFRIKRDREIGGKDIIEWKLIVGDQSRSSNAATGDVSWRQGDPIALELRWAKDSTIVPSAGVGPLSTATNGLTVRFAKAAPWALLDFILTSAAPASEQVAGSGPNQHVPLVPIMEFEVKTRPNTAPEATQGAAGGSPASAAANAKPPAPASPSPAIPTKAVVYMSFDMKKVTITDTGGKKEEIVAMPHLPEAAPIIAPSVARSSGSPWWSQLQLGSLPAGGARPASAASLDQQVFGLDAGQGASSDQGGMAPIDLRTPFPAAKVPNGGK